MQVTEKKEIKPNLDELNSLENKVKVFKESPYFANVDITKLRELASLATSFFVKKNEYIFYEQQPPSYFYILQEGLVKTFMQSIYGKNVILVMLRRGDPIHSTAVFSGQPTYVSAQAVENSTVLKIKRSDFLKFVADNPVVALNFLDLWGKHLHKTYGRLRDMAIEKVDHRVINTLNMLSKKFGNSMRLTAEEVAELSGTATETTFRILSRLKKASIISSRRGKIVVLDKARLTELSENAGDITDYRHNH